METSPQSSKRPMMHLEPAEILAVLKKARARETASSRSEALNREPSSFSKCKSRTCEAAIGPQIHKFDD